MAPNKGPFTQMSTRVRAEYSSTPRSINAPAFRCYPRSPFLYRNATSVLHEPSQPVAKGRPVAFPRNHLAIRHPRVTPRAMIGAGGLLNCRPGALSVAAFKARSIPARPDLRGARALVQVPPLSAPEARDPEPDGVSGQLRSDDVTGLALVGRVGLPAGRTPTAVANVGRAGTVDDGHKQLLKPTELQPREPRVYRAYGRL